MSDDEKIRVPLTEKERDRAIGLMEEARMKVQAFRQTFTNDTKGMILFIVALYLIATTWPSQLEKATRAADLTAEWVAAGEPEDPAEVPKKLMERHRRTQG
jgi:hypothetical protein